MGLMDKMKQQAEQALAKAQQGVSQGQAKIDQVQAKRQADALLRDLGAAYYEMQRGGGSLDAVDAAMKLVDEHMAAHGTLTGHAGDGPTATGGQAGAAPPGTTEGNFSIDDM